ncbi:MAG: hypothetical protein GY816_04905 [Cytophagales bacterium]|nr:hypothetical protein [Cytophagales bacterium]
MESPFLFGQVVTGDDFTNRQIEKSTVKSTLLSGNHIILISPRRYGKSSLIKGIFHEIQNTKYQTITVDLTASRSENLFLESFARQVLNANSNKTFWKKMSRILKNIVPTFSMSSGDFGEVATLSFNWQEKKRTIEEILELPNLIAKTSNKHQIIAIDEFQNIEKFEDPQGLQLQMRAIWQHHTNVSYCLYGSKRHMMEQIFTRDSSAFYNFGQVVQLQKIHEKYLVPFISKKFNLTKKHIDEGLALRIVKMMRNHPEYVQFFCHLIWTSATRKIQPKQLKSGLKKLMEATSVHFLDLYDKLNNTQVKVIKAILKGEQQLTSQYTLQTYQLGTSANVVKALEALRKEDFIEKKQKNYELINPAFEFWFRFKILQDDIFEIE